MQGEVEEWLPAAEGERIAAQRRTARAKAADALRFSEDGLSQAHDARERGQRDVEEAAERLQAIIGRARAGRSE